MADWKIKDRSGIEVDNSAFKFTRYRRKPILVDACELPFPVRVISGDREMKGDKNDWLILDTTGRLLICEDSVFSKTYDQTFLKKT